MTDNKKEYQFSIVIPTLNEGDYISNLLTDLKKQTDKNFEVIIVDGNSQDNTVEQAQEFSNSFPLEILPTKKKNVSYQRNLGAEHATGEYLIFMDADCRINPTFSKKLASDIKKFKYLIYMPTMLPEKDKYSYETYSAIINFTSEISHIIGKPFATSSTLIIEKNFFFYLGKYDEKMTIYEDQEIIQRAFRCGVSTKLLKDIGVVFCFRRFEKEGMIDVYRKYLIAAAYILVKGKIYENIVDYKMEGGAYHKIIEKDKKTDITFTKALDSIKKVVDTINSELKKI